MVTGIFGSSELFEGDVLWVTCREGVAPASTALALPAANAEAAANLASAAAVHAAAASAPSPPPADLAGPSHRHPPEITAHSLGA